MAITLENTPGRETAEGLEGRFIAGNNPVIFTFNVTDFFQLGASFQVFKSDGMPLSDIIRKYPDPVSGNINLDVAPYLLPELNNKNVVEYDSLVFGDDQNTFIFYIEYGQSLIPSVQSDFFYIADASKQILDIYGQNLAEYTILVDESTSPATVSICKFATEFERPCYFEGYPFDISVYNQFTDGTINYVEEGGGSSTLDYTSEVANKMLRVRLPDISLGVELINVFIEPGNDISGSMLTESGEIMTDEEGSPILLEI